MTAASCAALAEATGDERALPVGQVVEVAGGGPPQLMDDGQWNGRFGRAGLDGVDDHREDRQGVLERAMLQQCGDRRSNR